VIAGSSERLVFHELSGNGNVCIGSVRMRAGRAPVEGRLGHFTRECWLARIRTFSPLIQSQRKPTDVLSRVAYRPKGVQ
jgi:hypothetical protein